MARAFERLDVDSDLETGQNPPLAFFFVVEAGSADVSDEVRGVTVAVELVELLEESEEEELLRATVLRWGINIRETSSELMAEKPPPAPAPPTPFQLSLEMF